ncbi:hypothetical protein HCN44_001898 [Aphidius gifuensis]|uniref:DNA replication complex GINS protein PSF3 n=1 Tax=Aphidius gifuensis TaxID=684658 RepID=A0A834Y0C9_APHGI|nr:hypothetical protein HCN44_001898 [Aphidius gifuensis]
MSLITSYTPNYFSINDILATEERILCTIEITLPRLGFLDVSTDEEDLKKGTKLEFPFWLAQTMGCRRTPIVSIEIPKYYKEGYREILEADACAVTLSRWNPCYYELGMLLNQFTNAETEKIPASLEKAIIYDILKITINERNEKIINVVNCGECKYLNKIYNQTFRSRIRLVMDWAQNPVSDPTLGSQLPILERNLFTAGRKARVQLISWLKEGVGSIETSEVVASFMKKRKRAEFEAN